MLHRYSEIFRTMLLVADLTLVSASWIAAYWLRFHTDIPAPLGTPEFTQYLVVLPVILPVWFSLFRSRGLYEPQRTGSPLREIAGVIGATAMGVVVLVAASFFVRGYYYSRLVIGVFSVLSATSIIGFRWMLRSTLRLLRRRGYNLRYVMVVGAGDLAKEVIDRLHAHPEAGLRVIGALSGDGAQVGRRVAGVPVIGEYGAIKELLAKRRVDQVVLALPRDEHDHVEKVLRELDDEFVSVRMVPDLLHVMTLRSSVEDLDGLPTISLRDTPLVGWAAVQKRVFDVVVGSLLLVLFSPLLAVVALAVRLTSGSPVLYRQKRMGLDGRVFDMLKFRTMRADAEKETGPVWTSPDDPRRTRLGAFLRSTSLDEWPQLINVVRGDMSLVGPRPERPVFIERFRREVPGYMLRHKVKAGLTGWAQVHGWRGDTSLHERIEHDIYYIQNWSLALDLRILVLTLWRGFVHRNAY
jgi:Undecaprenyl-phosphate glucose phosphotransferase